MAYKQEIVSTLGLTLHPDSADCTPEDLAVNISVPRHPEMSLEKRLQANHSLPASFPANKIIAAEAGLYYLNLTQDTLKCYYCDIEIGDWETGDLPWEKHVLCYPSCPHLKINRVSQDIARDEPESTMLEDEALRGWNRLSTCIPQQESQPAGIKVRVDNAGTDDGSGPFPESHYGGSSSQEITRDKEGITTLVWAFEENSLGLVICVDHHNSLDQGMKTVNLCKTCRVRTSSVVFLPCGHIVTCGQCGLILDKCPLTTCNRQIKGNFVAIRC